jgi:hypothetical protein
LEVVATTTHRTKARAHRPGRTPWRLEKMDQLEALKQLLRFETRDNKRVFICEWLEDINWHTECRMVRENTPEYFNELWDKMDRLYLVANEKSFTLSHWNGIKDDYTKPEDYEDLEKLRAGKLVFCNHNAISREMFYSFEKMKNSYSTFSAIWGYGLDGSLGGLEKSDFVAKMEEIINEKNN